MSVLPLYACNIFLATARSETNREIYTIAKHANCLCYRCVWCENYEKCHLQYECAYSSA